MLMRLFWIVVGVVLVDQAAKVTVLQTMYRGQSIPLLGDWFRLTFTENPGMAFGITVGPPGMVTAFSILATLLIIAYLFRVRSGYLPYRVSLAFILGGALGNIIDRMFYGLLFTNGRFFSGHVVDFIHINLWRGYVPEGVPLLGGKYAALFPIWNVADMAIVLGVVGILIFQKRFHDQLTERPEEMAPLSGNGLEAAPLPAASSQPAASSVDPVDPPAPATPGGSGDGTSKETR